MNPFRPLRSLRQICRAVKDGTALSISSFVHGRLTVRVRARLSGQDGMSTAEYAVGTIAAVAFAGLLIKVVNSGAVESALTAIIEKALS